jgi:hypothetical protein
VVTAIRILPIQRGCSFRRVVERRIIDDQYADLDPSLTRNAIDALGKETAIVRARDECLTAADIEA